VALSRIGTKLFTVRTLARAGVAKPARPDRLLRGVKALRAWGKTPAAGYGVSAARYPDEPAIIDELGTVTFAELNRRTNGIARRLKDDGLGPGRSIAILCRNHRAFVEATLAASKTGADMLYLNTSFAGPQIAEVCRAESPVAMVHDAEFTDLVAEAAAGMTRYVAWPEPLASSGDERPLTPPERPGRVVILTSGTTGAPKGAGRHHPRSLDPAAALLDMIPLRARERTLIAAPMFHSWGLAHFNLGLTLSTTLVLLPRFDPNKVLDAIEEHRVNALIVVPVMLQRLLEARRDSPRRHDLSSLRVVAASGSALPGHLANDVMDQFGDVLYNLYGSTEVAWATIATPRDLRDAPGTAGRPPHGTVLRLYDGDGRVVPRGAHGRIYVSNEMQFEGYTGGGSKDTIDGLMSSGDVGHLDMDGRLFVDGRDDEMIISGGENVFPREVEDLLADHPSIEEVAVVGVSDDDFGQRLRAFVVVCEGEELTEEQVKEHVRDNLARFKVPRDVVFLDELPRNATGKVLKRVL
jgi:acyl-CoA synthetase (AMP-forming)/AMP-acid ligase II